MHLSHEPPGPHSGPRTGGERRSDRGESARRAGTVHPGAGGALTPSAHVDTFARDHLPPPAEWPLLDTDLPGLRYPDRLNCGAELLDVTLRRHGPDRTAFVSDDGRTWTYGSLRALVCRIAHVLTGELGVRPGNRVLLRGPTTPQLAACWLAVQRVGAVAVTVLAAQRARELRAICDIARVGHALCDAGCLGGLVAADAPGLRITPFGGSSAEDLLRRAEHAPPTFTPVDTAADDVALIAFTSGTTGRPKGCVHFHRDVLAIADTFSAHVLRPRSDDLFAGSPPLGFTFGLGGLVVFPLRAGAAALLHQWGGPEQMLRAIARHRVSVLFTAPTAYRGMLAKLAEAPQADRGARGAYPTRGADPRQDANPTRGADATRDLKSAHAPYDIGSLRRCVSAGENLPAATWRAWYERTGLRLINGIGATEMLHIFVSAADDAIRPGTTGVAVPGFQARVVRHAEDGLRAVPDGEPGLLAVRGPVGCRYLADPRQRAYVRDGWNLTGDTYVRNSDGYFRYVARADDMIVSAGYNIAGPEVEEVLLHHPDVAEAAVVGHPDERRGQIAVAHVVLRTGARAGTGTAEALRAFVAQRLTPYKSPRRIVFTDALPRTPTGKVQRYRLRETAIAPEPDPDPGRAPEAADEAQQAEGADPGRGPEATEA